MDYNGFYTGKIFDAYEYFGCHLENGGATFRVFAPAAGRIALIGDFNGWNETEMNRIYNGQFFEVHVDNVKEGMMYKYRIYSNNGCVDHCDPYGFGMELRPASASIVRDMKKYKFKDEKWMRSRTDCRESALNIYELHMGSWKKNEEDENGWYNYSQMADLIIPYLKEEGYNYIEVMPLSEHPCDESWGYQCTGFYSPTSRYGTSDELKEFIDKCHQNNIGVILDFVPVHFAVDGYALANFDGTDLYEYPNGAVGNSEWGSKNFNHSRGEIQSFLQSNANYWIKEYHFDGLRMDAINNIIYWQGDAQRGTNANALEFVRNMNGFVKKNYPSVILAAEDSSAFPGVTKPVNEGGLGFDYKWDMGWMNDTLAYFRTEPGLRSRDYHKLTFSMMYYYDDRFLLPFSHDEVVHGKATILQKMYGDYDDKFPQARALYMYMMTHPGKKLNFMGNEIGHFREWDEHREMDWNLLDYQMHKDFKKYIMDLNQIYGKYEALYKGDYDNEGFRWIDCHQEDKCIYAYERKAGTQKLVFIMNLSDREQDYEMPAKDAEKIKLLIASDMKEYGGDRKYDKKTLKAECGKIKLTLERYSAQLYIEVCK